MSDKPIIARPVTDNENLLREKYYDNIAAQSDLMDKLSERLLSIELAVPSIYVAALKIGSSNAPALNIAFYFTFGCWFVALALTLTALFPKKWKVNPNVLRQNPAQMTTEGLGIRDFFDRSAAYKRSLLIISSIVFFAGIVSAALTI